AEGWPAAGVGLGEAGLVHGLPTEVILADRDHRVLDADVLVDGDVVDVHDGRAIDDNVVDDARPAPADPRRPPGEAWSPPPRHERLAPAPRDPAQPRRVAGDGHAWRAEEGHERRRVDGPHQAGARP